ncbi:MAG: PilZ domain-containing protein [Armatimonadetes bacterium]|nr:PilZ domain-containing protein [Armatimonadota bacterium]
MNLEVGQLVTVVVHRDVWARLFTAEVVSNEPMRLKVFVDEISAVHDGDQALILADRSEKPGKARTSIKQAFQDGDHLMVNVENLEWESEDRRRYKRFDLRIPIEMSVVYEDDGDVNIKVVQGTSRDISLGGAWIEIESPLPKDTLVEFRTWVGPGKMVRCLSLVVHCSEERGGMGIEFVNYLENSLETLEEAFNEQAA